MPKNMSQAPYYDDYDPAKGYVQILAIPGNAEQAREFTQVASITNDFLGRLGDSLYRNGAIIDGCTLVIREEEKKVIISSGRIYLDGLVRLVDGGEVDISGVGSEVIGAKIESSIITEIEDPSLRDPAQGFENYGQEGAHRLKETVVFTVNDEGASALYRLEDGELVTSESGAQDSTITETLARRTYEENGNYKIRGLELQDRNETRDGKILISLTDGKAYIRGYEVDKVAAMTVKLNYAQTTREILSEPKGYQTGVDKYSINNSPVKDFTAVVAIVEVTDQITRGNITGGIDYLPKTPVVTVVEVKQGATTYIQGTDYQLTTDGIDWSLNGKDPSIGTTYSVTYRYNKQLIIGTDVELLTEDGVDYLHFIDGGDKPVANSQVNIDYQFYLARKDLICLTKDGDVKVLEGKPDIARLAESPLNQDENQLIIGTALVMPNSNTVTLVNFNTVRLSQADLYNVLRRVEDMEYNQALTDLDTEAMEGEAATQLKGVYTDGFIGLTKCDTSHPDFDCTIDLDLAELTLPVNTSILQAKPNLETFETQIAQIGRIITAPYTHEKILTQPYATRSMLVNPYAVFNPMCLVALTPAIDNWVDTEKIVVEQNKTVTTTLRRWWYHRGESWAEEERKKYQQLGFADGGESLAWGQGKAQTTSVSQDIIFNEAIMYMRQIEVNLSASNFTPNENNIECYFNDTKIPLTATGSTKAGTAAGTVQAGANGKFTAKFTVPANTPCGSVEVLLKGATSSGSAVYQAQGRKQIMQETVLTTTTIVNPTDPLAQSFSFTDDTIITKVGLYFAAKDPDKSVVVQIRNMVNGYPGTTCYAATTVTSAEVNISEKGTAVTEVYFDQPVYCKANEQYCICILSDSNNYQMFIAELGSKDLISGNFVTSQPYAAGVLFSSSNALTWTAHQTMDLKYDIYRAKYTGKGQILFNDITGTTLNRLVLAAQAIDYKNNGIEWFYKISDTGSWLPIETYVDRELSSLAQKIQLKAVINVGYSTSPIIAGDCINLIGFMEKTSGAYVSKTVAMDDAFTKLRLITEISKPSGTEVRFYYQTDATSGWEEITESPTVTRIDDEFSRYEWNKNDVVSAKTYKIKITLATSNPLVRPRVRKLMSILKY